MTKTLYLIRHCKATGQPPEAELTTEGAAQAETLADLLEQAGIERVIASPFVRAVQSAEPLAKRLQVTVEHDPRLEERVLAAGSLPNWLELLKASFDDLDVCYPGGESSRTAMKRAVTAVEEALEGPAIVTAMVSHGNLLTLLLKHFDARFGFEEWRSLSNPDVYRVDVEENGAQVVRVWK